MRSSFSANIVMKSMALAVLIAMSPGFESIASAAPHDQTAIRRNLILAQGDASLPPPDPSFQPRSRLSGESGGAGIEQPLTERPFRRRLRRRMNADGLDGAPNASIALPGAQSAAPQSAGVQSAAPHQLGAFARRQGFGNKFGGVGGGGNPLGRKALDLTSLNLSVEQKEKIKEMRSQFAPKTRELRKQLNAKRLELRDIMFEASTGDDQVRAKRKEVRQLQDKVEDLQLNDFLAIRSVLTPDQRQKLTDLKPGRRFSAASGTQLVAPAVSTP